MVYTLGRGWIEMLRIDTVELNDVFGLRFNVWTSIVLFVARAGLLRGQRATPPRPRGERLRRPGPGARRVRRRRPDDGRAGRDRVVV